MGDYRLRPRALEDLDNIWDYTVEAWSVEQAERYSRALDTCFRSLADNPMLGLRCDAIREGYWRIKQGRHVVFFRRSLDGTVVVERILHDRMVPARHLQDEE